MGPWLLGLANECLDVGGRALVGDSDVSGIYLDCTPMGLGWGALGLAGRLLEPILTARVA